MLSPEIQRIVLLIGLAATGYMLILAWFDHQEATKEPVSFSAAPLASDSQAASPARPDASTPTVAAQEAPATDAPTAPATQVANDDVPDVSVLTPQAAAIPAYRGPDGIANERVTHR